MSSPVFPTDNACGLRRQSIQCEQGDAHIVSINTENKSTFPSFIFVAMICLRCCMILISRSHSSCSLFSCREAFSWTKQKFQISKSWRKKKWSPYCWAAEFYMIKLDIFTGILMSITFNIQAKWGMKSNLVVLLPSHVTQDYNKSNFLRDYVTYKNTKYKKQTK